MRGVLGALALGWVLTAGAGPVAERAAVIRGGFQGPTAVAVATDGTRFVLDAPAGQVRRLDPDGRDLGALSLRWDDLAQGRLPTDLALDGERLYVADPAGHGVEILRTTGGPPGRLDLSEVPGDDPPEPAALALADGRLYWSDRRNHRVCVTDPDHLADTECWGGPGDAEGRFHYPSRLGLDAGGYLYVADVLNGQVQVLNAEGVPFGAVGQFGLGEDRLFRPVGVAVGEGGRVYVADAYRGTVSVFQGRRSLGYLRQPDGTPWRFDGPAGLALADGVLHIAEAGGDAIHALRLLPDDQRPPPGPGRAETGLSRRECLMCHASWDPAYPVGAASSRDSPRVLPVNEPAMCMSCHRGEVLESRHRLPAGHQHPTLHNAPGDVPPGASKDRADPIPGHLPLAAGGLHCGTCHSPHERPEGAEGLRPGHRNPWLRRANPDSDLCRECHASHETPVPARKDRVRPLNHPVDLPMRPPAGPGHPRRAELREGLPGSLGDAGARLGGGDRLVCQSCHRVHGAADDEGLAALPPDRLCAACHRSQHTEGKDQARRRGVHPVGVRLERPVEIAGARVERLECATCHDPHDAAPGTPLLRKGTDAAALCRACHAGHHAKDRDDARANGIHPTGLTLERPVRLAGREVGTLDCLTCHSVHGGRPGTPALVAEHRDGDLCRACHEDQTAVAGSDHDLALNQPDRHNRLGQPHRAAGLCGACHSMHRAGPSVPYLSAGTTAPETAADVGPRDRLCLGCHRQDGTADARPVDLYSHPHRDLVLRSDPKAMPLLGEGDAMAEFGRIGCVTCHDPHRWTPGKEAAAPPGGTEREGSVLDSFLRRRGPEGSFCVDCHGRETRGKYRLYHDARSRGEAPEYLR